MPLSSVKGSTIQETIIHFLGISRLSSCRLSKYQWLDMSHITGIMKTKGSSVPWEPTRLEASPWKQNKSGWDFFFKKTQPKRNLQQNVKRLKTNTNLLAWRTGPWHVLAQRMRCTVGKRLWHKNRSETEAIDFTNFSKSLRVCLCMCVYVWGGDHDVKIYKGCT